MDGDLGIGEEVVTCKLYLGLAFIVLTLERVTIGCYEVGGGGGGGGVIGGVGVVCGDDVDSGVRGVVCGVVCGFVCGVVCGVVCGGVCLGEEGVEKLYLLHIDLYGPMRVASINGKKYILVIMDDYSRFTWVKFLASKDEAFDFIIKFLKMIQVRLNTPARNIRTNNGTEFVNQTLHSYYESVGISYKTSVA
ncbi:retrovirus-related pol polyprotein from transposon TNT 1-94 [Tanacetum coccineum]